MNIKQLNEKLNLILNINEDIMNEFEVDSRFKTALQASRDAQTKSLYDEIEEYKQSMDGSAGDDYWKRNIDELQAKLKGKRSADYIYKNLARLGLDVSRSNIELLGNCKDLTSTIIRNKLKEKLADENLKVYLIADTKDAADLWHNWGAESSESGIVAWYVYYHDNILNIDYQLDCWGRDTTISSDIKGNTLMRMINNNKLPEWDFYIAYGPDIHIVQKDRMNSKSKYDRYSKKEIKNSSKFDKSGYRLDVHKKDLMKRLNDYKNNKGFYSKQATNVQNKLNDIAAQVKQLIASADMRNEEDRKKTSNVMNYFKDCISAIDWFVSVLNSSNSDVIEDRYNDVMETFDIFDKNINN